MNTMKVCFIGDGGVGKTTYLKRLLTGNFESKYIPTMGVEVHPLVFNTNKGNVIFNIWDVSGQEKYGGLCDSYYNNTDAFIVFFDVTSKNSYKNCKKWIEYAILKKPLATFILIGSKVNCSSLNVRKVLQRNIKLHKTYNIQYYDISSKSNYNCYKPFVYLIKRILGNDIDVELDY
jgi:GTP-binding nuclear protein Ran